MEQLNLKEPTFELMKGLFGWFFLAPFYEKKHFKNSKKTLKPLKKHLNP